MQQVLAFALPKTDWRPPRVADLPSWKNAKRVGLDVECRDEQLRELGPGCRSDPTKNYVCGFSFALEDGPEYYVPLRHEGGDNVEDPAAARQYLRDQIRDFTGEIVVNNGGYDLDWVSTDVCDETILSKKILDVQILDVLLNELQLQYNLDAICERLGLPGKDEADLEMAARAYGLHPKKQLWKLPARYVGKYAATDARRPLQALRRQEEKIPIEDIAQIWQLEQRVTAILVKMRRRGVRIDHDKLELIERRSVEVEKEMLDRVAHATGVNIGVGNVWKSDALAQALRVTGIEPERTATGKDSVDKVLLAQSGEVGKWLLRAREWNKLRTTFAKQVRQFAVCRGGDWFVHCTFNQMKSTDDEDGGGKGVRYGRLSSSEFNLQYQPIRNKEYGALWRSVFVAKRGGRWGCSDWSQQEPRIGVHYAEHIERQTNGEVCPGAKVFADEYRRNPELDIHQKLADISGIDRPIVKNYVNGRLYGMGDAKMCRAIGCPTEFKVIRGKHIEVAGPEGLAKIRQFNEFAPWIRDLVREAARAAEERGRVRDYLGGVHRFVKGPDGKIWKAHKAFNRVGQGSAARQMKKTLVAIDDEGIAIDMSVHDEFDFTFSDIREAKRVKELQLTVVQFSVPMKVDLEIGDNWGQLTKVED